MSKYARYTVKSTYCYTVSFPEKISYTLTDRIINTRIPETASKARLENDRNSKRFTALLQG